MKKQETKSKSKKEKKKLTPENKKRILTNAGKAIGKFMEMKKVSAPVLSKKTGIKIADINEFTSGKKSPSKSQLKLMYKALDIPKELVMLYSIESQDVSPRKRELFNELINPVKDLVECAVKMEDDKPKKKTKKAKAKK